MLIGCYEHNMDSKGRIIIPAKWRLDLGARIIVTCGFARKGDYQCLMGMSEERWDAFVKGVQNVSMADIVVQKALRKLFALACECELDKQGRILIPSVLGPSVILIILRWLVDIVSQKLSQLMDRRVGFLYEKPYSVR